MYTAQLWSGTISQCQISHKELPLRKAILKHGTLTPNANSIRGRECLVIPQLSFSSNVGCVNLFCLGSYPFRGAVRYSEVERVFGSVVRDAPFLS